MTLWLGVFALTFLAAATGDAMSCRWQQAVHARSPWKAARWAGCLALLGAVDLSVVAVGWPLSALIVGALSGSMAGTYWAVTRQQVRARIKLQAKLRLRQARHKGAGHETAERNGPAAQ